MLTFILAYVITLLGLGMIVGGIWDFYYSNNSHSDPTVWQSA